MKNMSKKSKYLIISLIVLAFVVGFGAIYADATLTLEALTITSSGTLTLNSAATSNIVIGDALTTGNIILGGTSGNIGISTANPIQKLDVNGTVKATAFIGDGSGLTNINVGTSHTFYVSSSYVGFTSPYFTTIQAAVTAASTGDIIEIAKGTYAEDITISKGLTLRGASQIDVLIQSVTVTDVNDSVLIQDISITTYTAAVVSVQNSYNPVKLINVVFVGNINFGTSNVVNYRDHILNNCIIGITGSVSQVVTVNTDYDSYQSIDFYNVIFINNTADVKMIRGDLVMFGGRLQCRSILYQTTGTYYARMTLSAMRVLLFGEINTSQNNASGISAFSLSNIRFQYNGSPTFTLQGKFEFNILNSTFKMPNIVYNSTVHSRFSQMIELGYNNTNTITGTGLAKLHIQKSIFHCAVPIGLGSDDDNSWGVFTDE